MVVYEVRNRLMRSGPPVLVPYEELSQYTGFRSVYGYGPEAAGQIREQGHTANLTGLPVYSHMLLVDFDDQPEAGYAMANALKDYDWVLFDSGGRSLHLHVLIEPMEGSDVPQLQKQWMRERFHKADMSIYKTAGIYRLPGTQHEATGRMKHVIKYNEPGKLLKIEATLPEAPKVTFSSDEDLDTMLMRLMDTDISKGTVGRNNHIYKIARVGQRLGLAMEDSFKMAMQWNQDKCYPALERSGIEATVRSAYR